MSNRGPSKAQLLEMLDAERDVNEEALRALHRVFQLTEETLIADMVNAALTRVTKLREETHVY
jgi:hypothetical protein